MLVLFYFLTINLTVDDVESGSGSGLMFLFLTHCNNVVFSNVLCIIRTIILIQCNMAFCATNMSYVAINQSTSGTCRYVHMLSDCNTIGTSNSMSLSSYHCTARFACGSVPKYVCGSAMQNQMNPFTLGSVWLLYESGSEQHKKLSTIQLFPVYQCTFCCTDMCGSVPKSGCGSAKWNNNIYTIYPLRVATIKYTVSRENILTRRITEFVHTCGSAPKYGCGSAECNGQQSTCCWS